MNKRRAFLFLLLSFVLMISSFAVSANEQTISDTLKNMHVLSSHDFEKYDDSTPVDDTDFSEDWNITYGGGEAFVYDAEGKKMLPPLNAPPSLSLVNQFSSIMSSITSKPRKKTYPTVFAPDKGTY